MAIKLVSAQALIDRMTLPEGDATVDKLIASSINGAGTYMAQRLNTSLTAGSASDVFHVTKDDVNYGGTFRLACRNGFIKNVVVQVKELLTDDWQPFPLLGVVPDSGVAIIDSQVVADGIRPSSLVTAAMLNRGAGAYVQVSYDYGFVDEDPNIPEWLSEAALSYSVQLMSMQQITDAKPNLNGILKVVQDHTNLLLDQYVRFDPRAIRPVM